MKTKKNKTVQTVVEQNDAVSNPNVSAGSNIFLNFNKTGYLVDTEEEYRAQLDKMIKLDVQIECVRVGSFKPMDDRNKMVEKLVKQFLKNKNIVGSHVPQKQKGVSDATKSILARIF